MKEMVEFTLEGKSVAADIEYEESGAFEPCSLCSQEAVPFHYEIPRVYEGEKEIALNSNLGRAIVAHILDRLDKPLCTTCHAHVMETELYL